jgi:hypothetical protein
MNVRFASFVFLIALFGVVGVGRATPASWTVVKLNLAPATERSHTLTATVKSDIPAREVELSTTVTLTSVREYFVSSGKLIVMGEAGRAQEVVILDLLARREADWFYCYYPQRVSEGLIAYVEFYPSMSAETPTDVVLLYDLTKSPTDNRLVRAPTEIIPAPISASPIQVGIPIYPQLNASGKSYTNHVRSGSVAVERVLAHTFVLLPPKRIIFVAAQGEDFARSHDYLAVVDLSRGFSNATYGTLDIPTDELTRPGENRQFVQVSRAEAISEDTVRLYVPQTEYGVNSIVTKIP